MTATALSSTMIPFVKTEPMDENSVFEAPPLECRSSSRITPETLSILESLRHQQADAVLNEIINGSTVERKLKRKAHMSPGEIRQAEKKQRIHEEYPDFLCASERRCECFMKFRDTPQPEERALRYVFDPVEDNFDIMAALGTGGYRYGGNAKPGPYALPATELIDLILSMCNRFYDYRAVVKAAITKARVRKLQKTQPYGGKNPGCTAELEDLLFQNHINDWRTQLEGLQRWELAQVLCRGLCRFEFVKSEDSTRATLDLVRQKGYENRVKHARKIRKDCRQLRKQGDEDIFTWVNQEFDYNYLWDQGWFVMPEGKVTKKRLNELARDAFEEIFEVLQNIRDNFDRTDKYLSKLHVLRHTTKMMRRLHETEGQIAALTQTKVAGNNKFWHFLNHMGKFVLTEEEKAWVFVELLDPNPPEESTDSSQTLWREWIDLFKRCRPKDETHMQNALDSIFWSAQFCYDHICDFNRDDNHWAWEEGIFSKNMRPRVW